MLKKVAIILIWLAGFCLIYPQTVSNIRVNRDAELGCYTIDFDLDGKADEQFKIKLTPYKTGKEILFPTASGGAGIDAPVTPGKNRSVMWFPFLEGLDTKDWQFRLDAFPFTMIEVEGGTFWMGRNNGERDEKPAHQVSVFSFYISKYEVTQQEWQEVMGGNPSNVKGDSLPVEQVTWYEAVDYCNKRSLKEGLKPCYSGSGASITCDWTANGYRLPTEAEWEYAARGGKLSRGFEFSGSNDPGSVAWYDSNSGDSTHRVGTKAGNELGLYDMSGNVWEWCWDWYGEYSSTVMSNPRGASSGQSRVIRGGSWNFTDYFCRVADRYKDFPDLRFSNFGVRVSRTIF